MWEILDSLKKAEPNALDWNDLSSKCWQKLLQASPQYINVEEYMLIYSGESVKVIALEDNYNNA